MRSALAFVFAFYFHATSHAAAVFWQFEGEFTIFSTEYANAGLSIGDELFGGVLFNSNAPDLHAADSVRGTYEAIVGFIRVPALGSHWTFAGPNNTQRITVLNDNPQVPPFDFFEIFFRDTAFDQVLPNPDRQFVMVGTAGTGLFASDALPISPPPVNAFLATHPLRFAYFDTSITPFSSAAGIITRIAQVPEPSTLVLLALSLIALGFLLRRRSL